MLGWIASRMMGNGFSVGAQEKCATDKDSGIGGDARYCIANNEDYFTHLYKDKKSKSDKDCSHTTNKKYNLHLGPPGALCS